MSLTRYSNTAVALLCVAVLLGAAGTAAALTVSADGLPAEKEVGEEVSVTYTIDDPFTDTANEWTLVANTELENVRWTVTVLRAGTPVEDGQTTYGQQSFEQDLNVDNNGDEVKIELVGDVPAVSNYTYEPEQTFLVASLDQRMGSNTDELANDSAHYYTTESREARQKIDDARAAIDDAGGNQEAQNTLDDAKAFYDSGDFERAKEVADRAKNTAESSQRSEQTMQLALMGAGAVVVLLLIGGGIYVWLSQRDDGYSKL